MCCREWKDWVTKGTFYFSNSRGGAGLNKALGVSKPDGHQLPVSRDADGDLLASAEETAIGYLAFNPDQNRTTVADGVELAQHCAGVIDKLYLYNPETKMPIPYGPYKVRRAPGSRGAFPP